MIVSVGINNLFKRRKVKKRIKNAILAILAIYFTFSDGWKR